MMKYFNYIKYTLNYIKIAYYSLNLYNNPDKINDSNFINKYINIISNNGCMLIKIFQWGVPRYVMINGTNKFTKILDKATLLCRISPTIATFKSFNFPNFSFKLIKSSKA